MKAVISCKKQGFRPFSCVAIWPRCDVTSAVTEARYLTVQPRSWRPSHTVMQTGRRRHFASGIPFEKEMSLVRPTLLNRGSGLANDVDDNVRLGKHDDVAAVGLDRVRVDAFRQEMLKIRMHRLVLLSEDVPARLRLPRNLVESLLLEQVGSGWVVGRPDQLLLLLGKVSREVLDAFP